MRALTKFNSALVQFHSRRTSVRRPVSLGERYQSLHFCSVPPVLKSGGSFPTLLICDFGLSTRTDITKGQPQRAGKTAAVRAGSLVGTIDYMVGERRSVLSP